MEVLDEVDKDNKITGNVYERDYIHKNNLYHRHVSAWIMNEKGQVLLQKRSLKKKKNPGKWAKTGGHVESGEVPIVALKREIFEEIGLDISEDNIINYGIFKSISKENYFSYNFIVFTNLNESQFILQKEEVSFVKYFEIEELEKSKLESNENFTFCNWSDESFFEEMKILKKFRRRVLK